jgi:hypothetical protein
MKNVAPTLSKLNDVIRYFSLRLWCGMRPTVYGWEVERLNNYRRRLLPPDTRFPQQGDEYEALKEVKIRYQTHWRAPYTGGAKAPIKKGERIFIKWVTGSQPLAATAIGENHEALESRMVSLEQRQAERYDGFSLQVTTRDLNSKFKLLNGSSN